MISRFCVHARKAVVLCVAAGIAAPCLAQATPSAAAQNGNSAAQTAAPVAAAEVSSATAVEVSEQKVVFNPKSGRNPFLSPEDIAALEAEKMATRQQVAAAQAAKTGSIVRRGSNILIQGIIGKMAIVNNQSVSAGGYVGDVKVISVGANSVTFEENGMRFTKAFQELRRR
ncbi:MAG: hypothetical protein WC421_08525 [Elusimicrobiales bacterium]